MGWKDVLKVVGGVIPNLIAGNGPGIWGGPILNTIYNKIHKTPPINGLSGDGGSALSKRSDAGPGGGIKQDSEGRAYVDTKKKVQVPSMVAVQGPQAAAPMSMLPVESPWLDLNPITMDRKRNFKNPYGSTQG